MTPWRGSIRQRRKTPGCLAVSRLLIASHLPAKAGVEPLWNRPPSDECIRNTRLPARQSGDDFLQFTSSGRSTSPSNPRRVKRMACGCQGTAHLLPARAFTSSGRTEVSRGIRLSGRPNSPVLHSRWLLPRAPASFGTECLVRSVGNPSGLQGAFQDCGDFLGGCCQPDRRTPGGRQSGSPNDGVCVV